MWDPWTDHSTLMETISAGNTKNAQALQKAASLPARRIAFVNDDPEMCEWALQWAAQGYFGRGSQVAVFDSLDTFLQRLDGNITYDVVLIDWVLGDGFALTAVQRLRTGSNANSLVLLNSALLEHEVKVEEMYQYGLDGFVSSVGVRADTGGARIATALYNYAYYKKLYGWKR